MESERIQLRAGVREGLVREPTRGCNNYRVVISLVYIYIYIYRGVGNRCF
jgi:hypothetical protein